MRCSLRAVNGPSLSFTVCSDRTDRNVALTDCISASILDNPVVIFETMALWYVNQAAVQV